jgi:hypothetical protein
MWEVGVEVTEHISILMRAVDEEEIDWAVPALSNLTRGTHQGANILKQVEPLQVLPKFPEERAFAEVGIIAIKSIYTIDRFLAADTSKCKTGSRAAFEATYLDNLCLRVELIGRLVEPPLLSRHQVPLYAIDIWPRSLESTPPGSWNVK